MPYNQTVAASGGTAPYTYSVGGGALPAGLMLNSSTGAITGTPAQTGTANFNITATGSNNVCAGSQAYSITIDAAPPPTPTPTPCTTAGSLDPTFGNGGKVTTSFRNYFDKANAVARQSDGKIVVAGSAQDFDGTTLDGDFALARYNADGSLDNTFGAGGKVTTDFGVSNAVASAVTVQPDGKIIAAGSGYLSGQTFDFALARYNPDGSLDANFGTGGRVTTDFNSSAGDFGSAMALQPDGKIVVAGYSQNNSEVSFALARYNLDGSLDTSFDTDGRVTANFGSFSGLAYAVALQPDGKIVAAGGTAGNQPNSDFALMRFNPDGSLDTSFDADGKLTTDFNSDNDGISGIVLQPDGKIVAAGSAYNGSTNDFALARYNPDGSLDTSFDTDGKVMTDFSVSHDVVTAVARQADSKIVTAGYSVSAGSTTHDFALARYNSDGSLDASFDMDGKATPSISTNRDAAYAVVLQPDGNIVAAGFAEFPGDAGDFALARLSGNCAPTAPAHAKFDFDGDGKTDVAYWNPTNHNWYIRQSGAGNQLRLQLDWGNGSLGDVAVPADYDGDGKTDIAVYRPSEGNWYIIQSATNTVRLQNWGASSDKPAPADFDGDGKTDIAVFRPAEGNWYVLNSATNTVTVKGWGASSDIPVPGFYDLDAKADIAVYRPSEGNWYIIQSATNTVRLVNWGTGNDVPVPADYDGDGRTDLAVFRLSDRVWFINHSGGGAIIKHWGDPGDKLIPGDYDGDGKADIAVFRPSGGEWWIIQSATNTLADPNFGFGATGDVPAPSTFIPQ